MKRSLFMNYLKAIIIGLIILFIFDVVFYKSIGSLALINSAFLTGLVLFIAGAVFFVIQGGFFDGVAFGMKRFFTSISRSAEYAHSIEEENKKLSENKHKPRVIKSRLALTYPLITAGLLFILLSMIASYLLF